MVDGPIHGADQTHTRGCRRIDKNTFQVLENRLILTIQNAIESSQCTMTQIFGGDVKKCITRVHFHPPEDVRCFVYGMPKG